MEHSASVGKVQHPDLLWLEDKIPFLLLCHIHFKDGGGVDDSLSRNELKQS